MGGRLGFAGGGPRARRLTRRFLLGPVASPLKLLVLGDGFLRLGFLLAAGMGGGMALVAVGGALLPPSGCSGPPGSVLKIL